jgi:hypothetical protein
MSKKHFLCHFDNVPLISQGSKSDGRIWKGNLVKIIQKNLASLRIDLVQLLRDCAFCVIDSAIITIWKERHAMSMARDLLKTNDLFGSRSL